MEWGSSSSSVANTTGSFHLKKMKYEGDDFRIICQEEAGPCSLLCICNGLILSKSVNVNDFLDNVLDDSIPLEGVINMVKLSLEKAVENDNALEVHFHAALSHLDSMVVGTNFDPVLDDVLSYRHNSDDHAIIFLMIESVTGLGFYHALIYNPNDIVHCESIGHMSYNEMSDFLLDNADLLDNKVERNTPDEKITFLNGLAMRQFLKSIQTQITDFGIESLRSRVMENKLFVLFSDRHFFLACKKHGKIFLLSNYHEDEEIIWNELESASNVIGDQYDSIFETRDLLSNLYGAEEEDEGIKMLLNVVNDESVERDEEGDYEDDFGSGSDVESTGHLHKKARRTETMLLVGEFIDSINKYIDYHKGNSTEGTIHNSHKEFDTFVPVKSSDIYKEFVLSLAGIGGRTYMSAKLWENLSESVHGLSNVAIDADESELHQAFQTFLDRAKVRTGVEIQNQPRMNAGEHLCCNRLRPDLMVTQRDLPCSFMPLSFNIAMMTFEIKKSLEIWKAIRQALGHLATKVKTDMELARCHTGTHTVFGAASDAKRVALAMFSVQDTRIVAKYSGDKDADCFPLVPEDTAVLSKNPMNTKDAPTGIKVLINMINAPAKVLNQSYSENSTSVPGYILQGVLGSGGSSTAYTACRSGVTGRSKQDSRVVIKMGRYMDNKPFSGTELKYEVGMLKKITTQSENVCEMIDHNITDTQPNRWKNKSFIVFKDIGVPLSDFLFLYHGKVTKSFCEDFALNVVHTGLCAGIDHLAMFKIMQADMRPENVIVVNKNTLKRGKDNFVVKIIDFGHAVKIGKPMRGHNAGFLYQHDDVVEANFNQTPINGQIKFDVAAVDYMSYAVSIAHSKFRILSPPWKGASHSTMIDERAKVMEPYLVNVLKRPPTTKVKTGKGGRG